MAVKTIYYSDELNDDFSEMNIKHRDLPADFDYMRKGLLYKFFSFVLYRIIAPPVALAVCKLHYGAKYVGRKKLKECKGGYFLYMNHTMAAGDAFSPHLATYPRKTKLIVGTQAVSNRALLTIVPMLHGVPLPCGLHQTAKFTQAIAEYIKQGDCVGIYPEAHLWKYYSGIRPFKDTSFDYPARLSAPVYSATVTYKKRKLFKRPRVVVYIDGPFLCDPNLTVKENRGKLRGEVYSAMCERAKDSYAYYEYIKAPTEN